MISTDKNFNIIIENEPFDDDHAFIYILLLNKNNRTISQTFVRDKKEQEIKFSFNDDGYYTLCRVIITKDKRNLYYYEDGKIYKSIWEIPLLDLIKINPEQTKINISYYYYFLLNKLRRCFVNAALKVINNRTSINCNNDSFNNEDVYKRDLLWTSLNVIKYLVDLDLYEEAERLLERISGCNGLCNTQEFYCSCGCK